MGKCVSCINLTLCRIFLEHSSQPLIQNFIVGIQYSYQLGISPSGGYS